MSGSLTLLADSLDLDRIPDEDWPDIFDGIAVADSPEHAQTLSKYLKGPDQ